MHQPKTEFQLARKNQKSTVDIAKRIKKIQEQEENLRNRESNHLFEQEGEVQRE